ncbi:hypothetical protein FQZ97_1083160 [compost metagenome]
MSEALFFDLGQFLGRGLLGLHLLLGTLLQLPVGLDGHAGDLCLHGVDLALQLFHPVIQLRLGQEKADRGAPHEVAAISGSFHILKLFLQLR